MERLFGRHGVWNEVKTFLLEAGVLECDGAFAKGVKAMHYWVSARWCVRGITKVEIRNRKLRERVKCKRERDNAELSPAQAHLQAKLKLVRVDLASAGPVVLQATSEVQRATEDIQIQLLQSGIADLLVDRFGRCHSPVTNMRRVLRPSLRFGGLPIAELDVANSQPMLLACITTKILAADWPIDAIRRMGTDEVTQATYDELGLIPASHEPPTDVQEFMAICREGRFYEAMGNTWGLPTDTPDARDHVKEMSYKHILFGPVRPDNQLWEAFRQRFPNLAEVVRELKSDDYRRVARACQRLEASLVIGGMVESLRVNEPGLGIQTIHDSVLTVDDDDAIETVRNAMVVSFERIGHAPTIRQKGGTVITGCRKTS
jgi:hypothetical protein